MKIGLSTWSFPWALQYGEPLVSVAERAVQMGAEVFQIADNCDFYRKSAAAQREILRVFEDGGVRVEFGTAQLAEEELIPVLELCEKSGGSFVRTLPHRQGQRMQFAEAVQTLRALEPHLRARKIVLGIENHDFYPCAWLKGLVEEIGSPYVGICLDAVNNLGQGESFREVFAALADHTVNFHCKDYVIRRRESKLGFIVSGCACGEGMLDFSLAATKLGDLSWVVELWTDEQATAEETLLTERQRAAASVAFLKKFRNRSKV